MVKDIYAGAGKSSPSYLTNVNGVLYFNADDGTNGYELWRSDGTAAGTFMVKDIYPGTSSWGTNDSFPSSLTHVNGVLYFSAGDGTNGEELWRSDGTAAGTFMVKDIYAGSGGSISYTAYYRNSPLTHVNGVLYFMANDGTNGWELWRSDGTAAGTFMVKDIYAGVNDDGANSSSPSDLINVNGVLYFITVDGINAEGLWRSDGTAAGTAVMVKGINNASLSCLANVNGLLYFVTANEVSGNYELWAYATGFAVTPSVGTGGSISPNIPQTVDHGGTTSFTITPDEGYSIALVTGCGGRLYGDIYITAAITADCTVTAFFRETDSDGDGDSIDDAWELEHFKDLTTADAKSDFDEDSYSDLQEYLNALAGETDPAGSPYNPKEKNAPGGIGYHNPMAWLPAVKLLLKR
ncbi:MAG: ELWxxDGT repeat protein [Candidatus Electronema sp. V4]|uniref:ELWxxDGT repeat protein n=1 Tax=Candidatus Electronema sp. V4 TaxID=3454756 RepID=UPI0040556B4E